MQLPGGIVGAAGLERGYAFKPLTGALEVALAEIATAGHETMATRVTRALAMALARVGGQAADVDLVGAMCVGDRQYLMQQLARHLERDGTWLTATCGACGAEFDFYFEPWALPAKCGGSGYPFVDVDTTAGVRRFRVPTGDDQSAVAELDLERAVQALLERCALDRPSDTDAAPPKGGFAIEDVEAIESALEAVAPEATTEAHAACPGCGTSNVVGLDPYAVLTQFENQIFDEVHALALHYHWDEASILGLPRSRRRRYLALIERATLAQPRGSSESGYL